MQVKGYRYQFRFNAMHNLTPDMPEQMHAHTFRVVAYVRCKEESFTMFDTCEAVIREYLENYEGQRINEKASFVGKLPTLENMCEIFFADMERLLQGYGVDLIKLEVGDSPLASFSIGKELLVGSAYNYVSYEKYAAYCRKLRKE